MCTQIFTNFVPNTWIAFVLFNFLCILDGVAAHGVLSHSSRAHIPIENTPTAVICCSEIRCRVIRSRRFRSRHNKLFDPHSELSAVREHPRTPSSCSPCCETIHTAPPFGRYCLWRSCLLMVFSPQRGRFASSVVQATTTTTTQATCYSTVYVWVRLAFTHLIEFMYRVYVHVFMLVCVCVGGRVWDLATCHCKFSNTQATQDLYIPLAFCQGDNFI